MYRIIRNAHLLLASFSLPFLIMYGISAVQMSHSTWFEMKPRVQERRFPLSPGQTDGRAVARELMSRKPSVEGEVTAIAPSERGLTLRVVVPGTVHDVAYDASSGTARVKTSIGGVMVMLNRLHHWAGLWHEPLPMKIWAVAVALVSAALLLLGLSGLYMWFTRRAERRAGLALLALNVAFAVTIIILLRRAGP
jgi:hypothetical protein